MSFPGISSGAASSSSPGNGAASPDHSPRPSTPPSPPSLVHYIPQVGDIISSVDHRSLPLRPEIDAETGQQKKGRVRVSEGTVLTGSSRIGGCMPDVVFNNFSLPKWYLEKIGKDTSVPLTFVERCRELRFSHPDDALFIGEIEKLVSGLVNARQYRDCQTDHLYQGRDYTHPAWKSLDITAYARSKDPIPVQMFTDRGFGDCRVTNGLLAFGLDACGMNVEYCYCAVVKCPNQPGLTVDRVKDGVAFLEKLHLFTSVKKLFSIPTEDHALVLWKRPGSGDAVHEAIVLDAYFGQYDGHKYITAMEGVTHSTHKVVRTGHVPVGEETLGAQADRFVSAIDRIREFPRKFMAPPIALQPIQPSRSRLLSSIEGLRFREELPPEVGMIKAILKESLTGSVEAFNALVARIVALDEGAKEHLHRFLSKEAERIDMQDDSLIDPKTHQLNMQKYIEVCRLRTLANLLNTSASSHPSIPYFQSVPHALCDDQWLHEQATTLEGSCAASLDANSVQMYPSTQEAWPMICRQISQAQDTVSVETFVLAPGPTDRYPQLSKRTDELFAALRDLSETRRRMIPRPRNPVKVRIIVDHPTGLVAKQTQASGGWGGMSVSEAFKERLSQIDPNLVEVFILGYSRENARAADHAKIFQIDDQVVISSGNIADYTRPGQWGDTHEVYTSIQGPQPAEVIRERLNYVVETKCELLATNGIILGSKPRAIYPPRVAALAAVNPHPETEDARRVMYLLDQSSQIGGGLLQQETVYRSTPIHIAMITALRNAKTSICIATPNLQSPDFLAELQNALARGVRVQIILPERMNAQAGQALGLSNGQVKDQLEAFAIAANKAPNLEIKWYRDELGHPTQSLEGGLHAKLILVDGSIAFQGSHNCDVQSVHSREVCLYMTTKNPVTARAVADYQAFFNAVFARGSLVAVDEQAERPDTTIRTKIAQAVAKP
jgi:phosphatidylserine/phosphatidylglycerophosphate/cardiolipin synthase-like enzyme